MNKNKKLKQGVYENNLIEWHSLKPQYVVLYLKKKFIT